MNYPSSKAQPVPVTYGGVSYVDSFKWLEEDSPETLAWQAQQDRFTQQWFEGLPSRRRAEELMDSIPRAESDFPVFGGGRWFRKRTPQDRKMHVLEVASSIDGPWRRVLDLDEMSSGKALTLDAFIPSPDGRKLVYSLGVDGTELAEMHVIDVDTGEPLQSGINQARAFFAVWSPDSRAFYYTALDPAVSSYESRLYRQVLGEERVTRNEEYEVSASVTWAKAAADRKHMLLIADHLNPRPDCIREEAKGGAWIPFLKGETALFRGDIIGDRYYAVTNDGAPCGRLVSIPLATPRDRNTWKELVPGSEDVLATLLVVDGHLVLVDLVDTYSRMRVFDREGTLKGEIPLPGRGSITANQFALFNMLDMIWKGGEGEVLFPFSSPVRSPALYKANVHTLAVETLIPPSFDLQSQIHDYSATSADGARVPYHVIARADVDLSQPRPTVLYGYGGFQAALIPGWAGAYFAAWVQAGGVLVQMHLRGGGELGPQMWHQGRLEHKQNTFNDVHAIAEDVVARGITTAAKLGVVGGSNGGTMAAAVVVQRPELFRASVSQVPITDCLARVRDPISMAATLDYGDPNDPAMSEVIAAWSPYQNVKDGTSYPALLLDAGGSDVRCPPWHVRKQAARMQPANTSPHPILMRVREGVGHGAADVAGQRIQGADWLAFLIDQLGLEA